MESIKDERKKLFTELKNKAKAHKDIGAYYLIPNSVLLLGFVEWERMIVKTFPGLRWRGKQEEENENLSCRNREKFFYNRFFIEIIEEGVFEDFSKSEIKKLKKQGLQECLKRCYKEYFKY
jgi:hypothetical protein